MKFCITKRINRSPFTSEESKPLINPFSETRFVGNHVGQNKNINEKNKTIQMRLLNDVLVIFIDSYFNQFTGEPNMQLLVWPSFLLCEECMIQ